MTLYIALRIAEAYRSGGQDVLALRFFERIGKMYRKERWDEIYAEIRPHWLECARKVGRAEEVVRLLVEEIGAGKATQEDLLDYLAVSAFHLLWSFASFA